MTTYTHDDSFIPDHALSVTKQIVSIGGIERYSALINNSWPGPELRIPEDKVVWIRVYNDIQDARLTMAAYSFSDGTPLASQWPIPPNHFFDYEIKTANGSAGQFSLRIVDRRRHGPAPYQVDGERIFHPQELFNGTDTVLEQGLLSDPIIWTGETNGFIVNCKTISNPGADDPKSKALDVIEVEPCKTYRFRFIGATTLSLLALGFEDHTGLQIIESDGAYIKPHPIDILQISTGQRYSALFEAKTCEELSQLRKLDFYVQLESRARPGPVVTNYAIIRYKKSCGFSSHKVGNHTLSTKMNPVTPPMELPPLIEGYLDYELAPLEDNNFPIADEVTRRVIINIQEITNGYVLWSNDGFAWFDNDESTLPHVTPPQPYLVSLYENETKYLPDYDAAIANGGLDPGTKTFHDRLGEFIEVVLQHVGSVGTGLTPPGYLDLHPWHVQGEHPYDLGSGKGEFNSAELEERLKGTTPIHRDTMILYQDGEVIKMNEKGGWRAFCVRVDNPGVWMIRCHLLQHIILGMQTVWVFGDTEDIMKVPKPEVSGYLEYGGDVYGNSTHAP